MDEFYQRWNYVMSEQNINDSVLSRALEISHTAVKRTRTGKTSPSAKVTQAFVMHTGINGHWLLTGQGEMYHTPDQFPIKDTRQKLVQTANDLEHIAILLKSL